MILQSKEVGARIRRARNAKNWSQEKLAEKANLGVTTISKYETEGLADIDKIRHLSDVLGQDLMLNERDVDGNVNELGKQILIELIRNDGYMDFGEMVRKHMFGLDENVSTDEVVRIERIGMCVREQYTDFYDKERDGLFLTAKGLIFCKNSINNPVVQGELEAHLSSVITYEELLKDHKGWGIKDACSYQEYIDLRPAEKLVRNLQISPELHMLNYLEWLQKHFESGLEQDCYPEDGIPTLVPSVSFEYDLFYRMANEITVDTIPYISDLPYVPTDEEKQAFAAADADLFAQIKREDEASKLLGMPLSTDSRMQRRDIWKKNFPKLEYDLLKANADALVLSENDTEEIKKAKKTMLDAYKEFYEYCEEWTELRQAYESCSSAVCHMDHSEIFAEKLKEKAERFHSPYPEDWFTGEEVLEFIEKEYAPAQDDISRENDRDIAEIIRLMPQAAEYFDSFLYGYILKKRYGKVPLKYIKYNRPGALSRYDNMDAISDAVVSNCLPMVDLDLLCELTFGKESEASEKA